MASGPKDMAKARSTLGHLWNGILHSGPANGDGGIEAAADLLDSTPSPKPAAPTPPSPKPAAAPKPPAARPKSAPAKPVSPKPVSPKSAAAKPGPKSAAVSPGIKKKSTVPRPSISSNPKLPLRLATTSPGMLDISSTDDDDDDENPTGVFYQSLPDDSDEENAPKPTGKAPRKKRASRALTDQEKALRRQERNEARQKKERERRERDQQADYALASGARLASQSRRANALDVLDGLIPLGMSNASGMVGLNYNLNGINSRVRKYLNVSEDAERKPHEEMHDRALALQRATGAPGAVAVMEMRRALNDPEWLPYERDRDAKNRVSTKGMNEAARKEHRRKLREQAELFHRAMDAQRETEEEATWKALEEAEAEPRPATAP